MSWLGIKPFEVGATYTSGGMIFTVLKFRTDVFGETVADCLMLDDNPKFTKRIPAGTVMEVGERTSVWSEAMRIASPGEQGKVSS